ncbi:helix-turn-helix domain-containing protein [Leptolyngbya sp. FACHB-36]|uniref:helix-turn-helix domain-containing protein n=1 Tax=Leptolyngbya sp. FACHB-36 TaxID=2692808 RepID=UPI0016805E35|nr:RodZ domain-containing protein [Leptolyngbya sp. FACHB-36]MBD2022362.1 helix-turn-helix domain-containing protein [Leptolyngbya sp. FACHB-36]
MKNQTLRINREQAEKLAELGNRLQQFRQQQQISLEEVASRTLIPVKTLAAIESGDREHLPEPVYIQGFIRRYADAIGLNGAELASAFPTSSTPSQAVRAPLHFSIQAQLRPLHLYLLYMVLVMGAVSGLSYVLNRSGSPVIGAANLSSRTTQAIATAAPVAGPVVPGAPSPVVVAPTGPQKSVRVGLKLTDQSWLRVVADGKMEFEGVLPEGTQRTWVADQQVIVRAGNAGGVLVTLNNGKEKPLGQPGSVEEVTFGKDSKSANLSTDSNLTASTSGAF